MSGARAWGRSPTPELKKRRKQQQQQQQQQQKKKKKTPLDPPVPSSPASTHCPILAIRTSEVAASDRLPRGRGALQRPTRNPAPRHQTALVPRLAQPLPAAATITTITTATPMCQPSSAELVGTAIRRAVPGARVESLRALPCDRLQRAFSVRVSGGRTLMVNLPPPSTLRLLRSEQWLVATNFLVVKWILAVLLCGSPVTGGGSGGRQAAVAAAAHRAGDRPGKGKQRARTWPADGDDSSSSSSSLRQVVLPYIPTPVSGSPSAVLDLGPAHHVFEPARGVPVASLPSPLTAPERAAVDFQVGRLVRRLSEFTSPGGTFGPAVAVIGPRRPATQRRHETPRTAVAVSGSVSGGGGGGGGTATWANAFHSMLESILRDGEDMAVTISYEKIRSHSSRLAHLLDAVTVARLVVLDAGDDRNVLVSPTTSTTTTTTTTTTGEQNEARRDQHHRQKQHGLNGAGGGGGSAPVHSSWTRGGGGGGPEKKKNKQAFPAPREGTRRTSGMAPPPASSSSLPSATSNPPNLAVTGLWDWSNTVFGDPLFATVFSRGTSPEFLRGFRRPPRRADDDSDSDDESNDESDDEDEAGDTDGDTDGDADADDDPIIEDRANAPVRLLLYECYHATVCVVRQFYRPDTDSGARELAARRRLAAALARLGDVEDRDDHHHNHDHDAGTAAAGKRPRRASTDPDPEPDANANANSVSDVSMGAGTDRWWPPAAAWRPRAAKKVKVDDDSCDGGGGG